MLHRIGRMSVLLPAFVVACAPENQLDSADTASALLLPDGVVAALEAGETVDVLVRVDDAEIANEIELLQAAGSSDPRDLVEDRAARWAERAESFTRALPDAVSPERVYTHFPVVALRFDDLADAYEVAGRGDVISVEENVAHTPSLAQTLALVNQPAAVAAGFGGAGTSVAVLDTGADWTTADLGSCTAVGTPSTCRVAYAADFAPDDRSRDDSGHGTNVSAIVAGVAPEADILALDVFRTDGYAYSTDLLSALDWVISYQATYDIAAINMSLGSGAYTAECSNAYSVSFQSARSAGVAVAVASGNAGYTNSISSPACVEEAISVGAVYDASYGAVGWSGCSDSSTAADKVACFSNGANFLDIVAPGTFVSAGGYTMGGTSMASPHVAGALAVIRAANPDATIGELEDALLSSGPTITDSRNGHTFPRLDVEAAVADCLSTVTTSGSTAGATGGSGTFTIDTSGSCDWTATSSASWLTVDASAGVGDGTVTWTARANTGAARSATVNVSGRVYTISQSADSAPSGTVSIAAGALGTRTTAVTLTLAASDATGGVSNMCISNSSTCTAWLSYATSRSWTLSSGAGTKTVYVWYRDDYGNTSSVTTDSIVLDTTAPTNGTVTATGATGAVALSWTNFRDTGSGIASYIVAKAAGTTAPSNCSTAAWTGTDESATISGLTDGASYSFRVCAVDSAGNTSTGATVTKVPAPEYTAPSGSIVVNGGASWTASRSATVTLSASDSSGVSYACLSNTSACSTWFAMTGSKEWTLTSGSATKTVYAWFKDSYGNVSSAVTDTIGLDATVPTNGTVSSSVSTGSATLTWTGFSDAGSGLSSYKLVYGTTAPSSSCASGTVGYTGSATTATLTGLADGSTYTVRVCALDAVGNTSTGASTTVLPAPEFVAPTGAIVVSGDTAWTNSRSVTVASSATDATGVSYMCLSNSTTCSSWQAYATSASFTLGSTAGVRTVYAWFKDPYGNVSTVATDTIGYDATAPTGGIVTATPGANEVALSWSGYSDATSGVASYKVVYNAGTAPTSCSSGTLAYSGSGTSTTLAGLTGGTSYGIRVCAVDNAGNVSTGISKTAVPTTP